MDSSVYLVVSDLHLSGQEKPNRLDYGRELEVVFKYLLSLFDKYEGYEICLVFLGDIFDRSYAKVSKACVDLSLLDLVLSKASKAYSLVGNHEITYYSNNPFWSLVNSLDSDRLLSVVNRNLQPLGYQNRLHVLDSVVVGDTVLHMNHYGVADSSPVSDKINIAFYHKALYSPELITHAKMSDLPTNFVYGGSDSSVNVLRKYDYSFLGHLHMLYGTWSLDGRSTVYYLASLGRVSKDEVLDSFLERNIPAIIFEDNKFKHIEDNLFMLLSYEDSIIPEVDLQQRESYELQKSIARVKEYTSVTDDPISNIRSLFADNSQILRLIDLTLNDSFAEITTDFSDRIMKLRSGRTEVNE